MSVTHSSMTGVELHDPKAHGASHTNGADDIQDANSGQKGLMTAAYASQLDGLGDSSTKDVGTTAGTVCAGDDSRLASKWITTNTTLTCNPASGADFNGDDALQQAVDYLASYYIKSDVTVSIQLQDGVYGASVPLSRIQYSNPQGGQITINGQTGNAVEFPIANAVNAPDTVNNYVYIDDQSGAYSADNFAPGGNHAGFVVYIIGSTGNDGPYTVAAAVDSGSDIRLTLNESVNDATKDGTLYLLPANRCQLHFATDVNGFQLFAGILKIFGLYLLGNVSTGWPVGIYGDAGNYYSNKLILRDWANPVFLSGGALNTWASPTGLVATGGTHGLYALGASVTAPNSIIGNFAGKGVYAQGSGANMSMAGSVAGQCDTGYYAVDGASIQVDGGFAHNNVTGCGVARQGTIYRAGITNAGNVADYAPAGTPPQQGIDGGWIV